MEQIILEVVPPPVTWNQEKVQKWGKDICYLVKNQNILTITVPEVINETREEERKFPFIDKVDNVLFMEMLKHNYKPLVQIPNKISPRMSKEAFEHWVASIYGKGIRHLVVVGGERSDINYTGYSVLEASQWIKHHFPEMKVGGIVIFTRLDEVKRIIEKMKAGIDFFLSQIIFEASNLKQVTFNLQKVCLEEDLIFPRIYLSVALASKIKDIQFMKWLGVEFNSAVLAYLTEEDKDLENRSFEVVEMMLDEVFNFVHKEKIDLGFNIEHLTYSNLYLTEKLFKSLKQRIAE